MAMESTAGPRRPEISATKAVAVVAAAAAVGLAVGGAMPEAPPATAVAAPEPADEKDEAQAKPRETAPYANQRAVRKPRTRSE